MKGVKLDGANNINCFNKDSKFNFLFKKNFLLKNNLSFLFMYDLKDFPLFLFFFNNRGYNSK